MKTRMRLVTLAFAAGACLVLFGCGSGAGSGTPPPTPVIVDINGGTAGSGTVGSLFVVEGSGFGTATSGSSGYSVAFRDPSTNMVVANATVDFGTAGNWTDVFIKATVPNGLTTGTTYKVTVTTPAATSNAANFLVVAGVTFSPSTILWAPISSLPVAQQGFPTVAGPVGSSTYIYAIGGNVGESGAVDAEKANVATVYANLVNPADGTLANASWSPLTPLPGKRGFAAAVFADGFHSLATGSVLYALGGLDDTGAATATVYFAILKSDGTIPAAGSSGTWTATMALPQPLSALQAVVFHGRIYVAGGNATNGSPVAKVYSAKINGDGTLDAWTTLADLPVTLAFHQMVEIAGTLYVIGGDTATTDPVSDAQSASVQDTVYFNAIDVKTGLLAANWTTNGNTLNKAREKFSAVGAGGYLLVSGGLYGGNPGSSEESYSTVATDGTLSSFNGATGTHTISNLSGYNFYNHSRCYVVDAAGNPHVLILGGADVSSGVLHPEVWYQH